MDDKYAIFQFVKSLYIRTNFVEVFARELEYVSIDEPNLEGDIYGNGDSTAVPLAYQLLKFRRLEYFSNKMASSKGKLMADQSMMWCC